MATALQRKLKHAKRVHHQNSTGYGRDASTVAFVKNALGVELAPYQEELLIEAAALTVHPSRGLCGHCGNSEKVRKDGTLGAHGPITHRCKGSGQPYAGTLVTG